VKASPHSHRSKSLEHLTRQTAMSWRAFSCKFTDVNHQVIGLGFG
jgi:hypothetical protein